MEFDVNPFDQFTDAMVGAEVKVFCEEARAELNGRTGKIVRKILTVQPPKVRVKLDGLPQSTVDLYPWVFWIVRLQGYKKVTERAEAEAEADAAMQELLAEVEAERGAA